MLEAEIVLILGHDVAAAHVGRRGELQHPGYLRFEQAADLHDRIGIGQPGDHLVDRCERRLELFDVSLQVGSFGDELGGLAGAQQDETVDQHIEPERHGVGIDVVAGQGGGGDRLLQPQHLVRRLAQKPGQVVARDPTEGLLPVDDQHRVGDHRDGEEAQGEGKQQPLDVGDPAYSGRQYLPHRLASSPDPAEIATSRPCGRPAKQTGCRSADAGGRCSNRSCRR